MLSVVVIGTGNVARQLCQAWQDNKAVEVVQIVGRSIPEKPFAGGRKVDFLDELNSNADCYIFTLSDDAIKSVYQSVTFQDKLIVHTSGSVSIDALRPHSRRGVFYPLQTFSAGREIEFSQVPILLEAAEQDDREILQLLAGSLSRRIFWVDSSKRRQLHVAAIYLNNFTNHLLYLSEIHCKELDLDPDLLYPLLEETVSKAIEMGPYKAQTGPARRGDKAVIKEHLNLIKDPVQQEIYKIFSHSIQSTYENEL